MLDKIVGSRFKISLFYSGSRRSSCHYIWRHIAARHNKSGNNDRIIARCGRFTPVFTHQLIPKIFSIVYKIFFQTYNNFHIFTVSICRNCGLNAPHGAWSYGPHWASNRASFFNWPWNQNQAAVWPGSVSPAICIGWLKYLKNIWKEFPQICQHPWPGWLAEVYGMTLAPNLFRSTDTGQQPAWAPCPCGPRGHRQWSQWWAYNRDDWRKKPPTTYSTLLLHPWVKHWWLVVLVVNLPPSLLLQIAAVSPEISGYQDIYPRLTEICGAGCVGLADSRPEQSVIYEFLQPFSYDARLWNKWSAGVCSRCQAGADPRLAAAPHITIASVRNTVGNYVTCCACLAAASFPLVLLSYVATLQSSPTFISSKAILHSFRTQIKWFHMDTIIQ